MSDTDLKEPESRAAEVELPEVDVTELLADVDFGFEFVSEAEEHLDAADINLLELDSDPSDAEAISAVFRSFHTLKGLAGFLNLGAIRELAHEAETLLDMARDGAIELKDDIMDAVLDSVQVMKSLVEGVRGTLETQEPFTLDERLGGLLLTLRRCSGKTEEPAAADTEATTAADEPAEEEPAAPVATDTEDVEPPCAAKDDEACDDGADEAPEPEPKAPSGGVIILNPPKNKRKKKVEPAPEPVQEEKTEPAAVAPPEPEPATPEPPSAPAPKPAPAAAAKPAAAPAKKPAASGKTQEMKETVRVDAHRLDNLIDGIGELVIAEAMLSQSPDWKEHATSGLTSILGQMDKITRELQEIAMSLRMVPVKSTFQKMACLARDTSRKLQKKVDFTTSGEDTELDKTVVDAIGDPLLHMVRNAIDHGLEKTPADRAAAGKPEVGKVHLRAFHQSGSIHIEIEDDGRGMDREAILDKARSEGLIKDGGEGLTDPEVFSLIFEPGFSTAAAITDVSGRGVGLDVVKRNIERLRGKIDIKSVFGVGTTFSIRLPLTLAIIEGMVVAIGARRFIVPTLSIVRMVRPREERLSTVLERGRMLMVGDDLVPIFRLSNVLNCTPEYERPLEECAALVVEDNGRQYAMVVDELIGRQQIVIKGLGKLIAGAPGFSGGAIMPDGRVGLILDIGTVVRLAGELSVEMV